MKRMKMEITFIETIGEGYEEFKRYCEIRKYSKYTIMMLLQNRMGVFAKPNCLRAAHWHCPGAISFDPLFCR